MFSDLEEKLEEFYDLSEEEQEKLLKEINKRGKGNKAKFKEYLYNTGFAYPSNRTIFYEAIWTNPKGWDDFLYAELVYLLEEAEKNNVDAIEELSSIMYLIGQDMTPAFYQNVLKLLSAKVSSTIPEVRYECATTMVDIHYESLKLNTIQQKQVQRLLRDKEFKTRIYIYSDLKEANLLPANFKLSRLDLIRAKLTGYSDLLNSDNKT